MVIFLSNFLALLITMDAAGEDNRSALGGILVAINVLLILAVLVTSSFTVQQSVYDCREEDENLAFTVRPCWQPSKISARAPGSHANEAS